MSNQIELRQLRYFLAVATELHFRRAAARLYVSQPGLSRQIVRLEEHLGFPLFKRNNRKVALTPAGAYLQTEVTELLRRLDGAVHHARGVHEGLEGRLALGYVGSAMEMIIPDLLRRFRESSPNITYKLVALDNQEQVAGLLSRSLDFGFVRLEEVPPELIRQPLFVDTFSLVLPHDHWLTAANFRGVEQLRDEQFILFEPQYSRPYYERVMEIFTDAGYAPTIGHLTVHATAIYQLVENRFGLSIVPTTLRQGHNGNVKFIELTEIRQRTTLSAVWRRDDERNVVRRFTEML